ncbi:hypothetical protein GCM10027416_13250 [Okibacterium endophyticum]
MTPDRDHDALSWAGDDDETLAGGAGGVDDASAQKASVAPGWRIVGKPGVADGENTDARSGDRRTHQTSTGERSQMSSIALIAHGVIAGVFLLYTIGWLVAVGRDSYRPEGIDAQVMYTLGHWFAVLSPALWFGTTLWLTRGSPSFRWRFVAFVAGVVVLAPWPFIVGAA